MGRAMIGRLAHRRRSNRAAMLRVSLVLCCLLAPRLATSGGSNCGPLPGVGAVTFRQCAGTSSAPAFICPGANGWRLSRYTFNYGDGTPLVTRDLTQQKPPYEATNQCYGFFHTYASPGNYPVTVTNILVSCPTDGGSFPVAPSNPTINATETVLPASFSPAIALTASPPAPQPGQLMAAQVCVTTLLTQSVSSGTVDFGDGSGTIQVGPITGDGCVTVGHTFTQPGSFTIIASWNNLNDCGGATVMRSASQQVTVGTTPTPTSSRTATAIFTGTATPTTTPTPTPTPVPVFSVSIPVVAHTLGANNTVFLTDLDIENPSDVPVVAALIFSPNGGGRPIQAALTLAPGETRTIPDAARALFGVTNSFGGLRVETTAAAGQDPPVVVVTSRTYDQATGFGLSISGEANVEAQTSPSYVTGVQSNEDFRTQLGAFNITDQPETFVIVLRGPDGSVLGTSSPILLGPFDQYQNGVKNLFPGVFPSAADGRRPMASSAGPGKSLAAEFHPVGSSTVPTGYANVVDNHSGDLTYYKATQPGSVWYLPIFSRVIGRGGTVFKTELNLFNDSNSPAMVTLTFLERDRDNSTPTIVTIVPLNAQETKTIDDALLQLFGLSNTLGSIRIESDQSQSLIVGARIFADSTGSGGGTVGNQVKSTAPTEFYKNLSVTGLTQNAAFRAVVGLFNPNAATVAVNVTLKHPSGAQLGTTRTDFLAPQSMIYRYLTELFPDVALPPDESMTLKVGASDRITAFGIIVDNASLDLTYREGQSTTNPRVVGSLSPSPSQRKWNALAGVLAAGLWILRQIVS